MVAEVFAGLSATETAFDNHATPSRLEPYV